MEMVKKYGEGAMFDMYDIKKRYKDLKECIKRRVNNDDTLLQQWIDEYHYLTHMIYEWEIVEE